MTTTSDDRALLWAQVEEGFYVASLPGVFVGCVERTATGRFLARDAVNHPLRTFDTLDEATSAVAAAAAAAAADRGDA